jgi:hypothetical protein
MFFKNKIEKYQKTHTSVKNISVLVGENEISYFKIYENKNKLHG